MKISHKRTIRPILALPLQALGGDQAGYAAGAAGDVNGDGIDDVLIGAPFANGESRGIRDRFVTSLRESEGGGQQPEPSLSLEGWRSESH